MTPEKVIELAKQAGAAKYVNRHMPDAASFGFMLEHLVAFAQLVRNEVFEEAAVICESEYKNWEDEHPLRICATSIRRRKS